MKLEFTGYAFAFFVAFFSLYLCFYVKWYFLIICLFYFSYVIKRIDFSRGVLIALIFFSIFAFFLGYEIGLDLAFRDNKMMDLVSS